MIILSGTAAASTITGPDVEFDARDLLGVDNSAITQWDDRSGNARHATQGDGSLQPTVQTNELNGLQVGRFVPVDFLAWSGDVLTSTFTVIAVVKQTGGSASTRAIISANTGGGEGDIPTIWLSSNKIEIVRTDIAVLATSTTSLNTTSFYTVACTYNGSTGAYAFYLNGSADGSGTASTVTFGRFSRMCARNGNQSSFSGDMAYLGKWTGVLSGTELTTRFDALRTVWAHY